MSLLDRVITTADICREYGVSRQAVAKWRFAGLPHKAMGRTFVYNRKEVEEWLKKKKH